VADKDYPRIVSELIANAIATSRIAGENGRITRLVAGSIGRFASELKVGNEAGKADALLAHARDLLAENDGAEVVPALTAAVEALAAAH
tara:strand:- start:169094 stop:169360 length:267 start_codon:yes stop_codon:yes gene_type:complete